MNRKAEEPDRPGDFIVLSGLQPFAQGAQRLVFQHPHRRDLLVKVMRREYVESRFGVHGSFHNRHRRCGHYTLILRELREYLVACARSADCLPFMQEIVGLTHTDLGLGLVVRKVCGHDGLPALSLAKLVKQGAFDEARGKLLDHFLETLLDSDIVIDDLNPGNMVLGVDASGAERFVLIDGAGSSTFIPLKGMVGFFNHWSKRRYFERLRAWLDGECRKNGQGA
jgi:hypothetical protein